MHPVKVEERAKRSALSQDQPCDIIVDAAEQPAKGELRNIRAARAHRPAKVRCAQLLPPAGAGFSRCTERRASHATQASRTSAQIDATMVQPSARLSCR